jgi:hypothetical protein
MTEITTLHNFKFSEWTAGFFMDFVTSGQSTNGRHPENSSDGVTQQFKPYGITA